MNEKLKKIQFRLNEIKQEIEKEGADIEALTKETDELIEQRSILMKEEEKRTAVLSRIANGSIGINLPMPDNQEETATFNRSSPEYRTAFLKNLMKVDLTQTESRAFTSVSSSAGPAIPTKTADEILRKLKQYAPLLENITLLQVGGNITFAIEKNVEDAKLHKENAVITPSNDSLTKVTLTGYEITKLVQISKTVAKMTIDAFEVWLTDMLVEKIASAITRFLIRGTGSSEPTGVESISFDENNSITVAHNKELTSQNVRELIALLGGAYDRNAKFLMSKKTLFTDFMPLQDRSKNSIVHDADGKFYIYGYPVMLDEDVTYHEAYLGDFKKIVGNLAETVTITSAFDIDTNGFKFLGSALFDSKIGITEAFVKLIKETELG